MSLQPLMPLGWLLLLLVPALVLVVVRAERDPVSTGAEAVPTAPRWWARGGALLVLMGMGLGPSVPVPVETELGVAVEMFFVVDRTGSMAAEDWGSAPGSGGPAPESGGPAGTRLDGVRHDLPALVDAVPRARYSIIGWDSDATRQLPLTTDARAARTWASTVTQEITAYSSGSLVDRPLDALRSALTGAAERNPGNVRLVFFLSDGEQTAPGAPASYASLAPLVDGGAVLGYGTVEGGPMRSYDGSLVPDPEAPYILDGAGPDAPRAISRIDEQSLQAVADQLGVPYVHRTGPDDVTGLVEGIDVEEIASDGRREQTRWSAVLWPFALALVAYLAAETWWTVRGWVPLGRRPERSGVA